MALLRLLIAFWLLTSPAWAAIAEVASKKATSADCSNVDTCAVAFAGAISANHLLIACGTVATASGGGPASATVTDSASNSWTVVLGTACAGCDSKPFIAYAVANGAATPTVTVNPAGSAGWITFSIDAFSGAATSSPLSVDGGTSIGQSNAPADTITTSTANELIIGSMATPSSAVHSPTGSYTQIGEDQSATNGHNCVFRVATTATGYTVDWSENGTIDWSAQTASFKEPSTRKPVAPILLP